MATLFLLLLTVSFGVINISATSVAKHRLYQLGETAIQRAAHSISLVDYYSAAAPRSAGLSSVPIDCDRARIEFLDEVAQQSVYGLPISTDTWNCDGSSVTGSISFRFHQPLDIPLLGRIVEGMAGGESKIAIVVGANSRILP